MISEEQLCHVERGRDELLVHKFAVEVAVVGQSAECVFHQVHLCEWRRNGCARTSRQTTVGVVYHVYLVGIILTVEGYPALAGGLLVV